MPSRVGRARWLVVVALAAALAPPPSHAQERERGPAPESDRGTAGAVKGAVGTAAPSTDAKEAPPPPTRYDPGDEWPPSGEAYTPPGTQPSPEARPGGEPLLKGVELRADGRARLELGWDSNVFRAARKRRNDGFFHGLGELEGLARFKAGPEIFGSISAEGVSYFAHERANEMYASSFLEYFHPVAEWLDLGVQNTLEYSRQNLLDDNGDLLPRKKFNALDEEPRGFGIVHVGDDLSLELGAAYRMKDFEEETDKQSLDFRELRADAGLRIRLPWPDGKLKLKYRYRNRDYRELRATGRDGLDVDGAPRLEIQRHQANATFTQKLRFFGTELTAIAGYGFTYNRDTFENQRSYREDAGTLRVEWWVVKDLTRLEAEVRGGIRRFLVRRATLPTDTVVSTGDRVRQAFADVTFVVWQKIVDHLAVVAEVSYFTYDSTERVEVYERFVVQAGVEGSF